MAERYYVNLWDKITSYVYSMTDRHPKNNHLLGALLESPGKSERRVQGEALLDALGKTARWAGQELSLEATDDGWEIRIFSCYTTYHDDDGEEVYVPSPEIIITIPKDGAAEPSVVVKDPGERVA
jgi:hypothetical protein